MHNISMSELNLGHYSNRVLIRVLQLKQPVLLTNIFQLFYFVLTIYDAPNSDCDVISTCFSSAEYLRSLHL